MNVERREERPEKKKKKKVLPSPLPPCRLSPSLLLVVVTIVLVVFACCGYEPAHASEERRKKKRIVERKRERDARTDSEWFYLSLSLSLVSQLFALLRTSKKTGERARGRENTDAAFLATKIVCAVSDACYNMMLWSSDSLMLSASCEREKTTNRGRSINRRRREKENECDRPTDRPTRRKAREEREARRKNMQTAIDWERTSASRG